MKYDAIVLEFHTAALRRRPCGGGPAAALRRQPGPAAAALQRQPCSGGPAAAVNKLKEVIFVIKCNKGLFRTALPAVENMFFPKFVYFFRLSCSKLLKSLFNGVIKAF